ncbi:MAG TPA: S4 domain-containing protein [Steroidobacteraceae bacterium]|nr:S4 domain-containing protein [Steroidobacteraceae bacterium]
MRARARGRGEAPSADRVHKVLAAAGLGSRREIERWIREGRLRLNGSVPTLGAKLARGDRVTLDGRAVHWRPDAGGESHVLLYHRSPGDALDLKAASSRAAEHLRLPGSTGRWLAVQPMPPVDGGLEILSDDGTWVQRISRGAHALEVDYLLRVRGRLNDALLAEFLAATENDGEAIAILGATAQYGEGSNHWLSVTARATRSAPVRHWWAARGVIVSRLMRVRFGPIRLMRELPRGRSRAMTSTEREALLGEIAAAGAPAQRPAAE